MKAKYLLKNKWLSLKVINDPENGIPEYVYSHEERCFGIIIAILPFRKTDTGIEYLLRNELTPCWDRKKLMVSSITGGLETNSIADAVKELKEESGYVVDKSDLIFLGSCNGAKSSDTVYTLFSVDLTDKEVGYASGDGSELEAKAYCFWSDNIDNAVDPFVYVMHYRLNKYLEKL